MIDENKLVDRFLQYVSFDTQSDEEQDALLPSTPEQMVFARALAEELKGLGLSDVSLDDHGYVMATLPASAGISGPVTGFISHMDTSPDASGEDVKPLRVRNYDGGDVLLNRDKGIVFSVKDFPEIRKYRGQDILFTDGTTLLGADDKAGVAAIVTAMEHFLDHPEILHGTLRVGFTPDEETGRSASGFDVAKFGADFAYTVDGGELGGLEYENFNADNPVVTFHGLSVHTGSAKGKMKNALAMAAEWQQALPAGEKPEYTEGYEGFFHVYKITGDVETCRMHMLVRDHDQKRFGERKVFLDRLADFLNEKYGIGSVELEHHDVYYNMAEKIRDGHMAVVDLAREAMEAVGVTPVVEPIRGGTDGAQLSWRGLPCPNLFTGGANFHGRFEYLPIPSLVKACETVVEIGKRGYRI
ncbi:MAG: peptidase T [Acidaminococcus fermentans]|uniref:peptidase T n=1 Tax=Acidaminococcus fermentans TaxID=905 RepID=UPI00242E6C78|nr:peptidase T [Acidaminococcus fermentans]MCF0139467.1 peptidase T [Acidaminococcus fermentans]